MTWESLAQLVGRSLLGVFYLVAGLVKIPRWTASTEMMREEGMVLIPIFLVGAIVLQSVGGGLVALGLRARLGALMIIVVTIPIMVIFSDFWAVEGPERASVAFNFLGSLMIVAFALFIMGTGPGALSLERALARRPVSG